VRQRRSIAFRRFKTSAMARATIPGVTRTAFAAVLALTALVGCADEAPARRAANGATGALTLASAGSLRPPDGRPIRVAFAISDSSNVIDMSGPWEVFQDAAVHGDGAGFTLYTVAATRAPVRLTGGLQVVPDYAFADAPQPDVVVVPAIRATPELHAWLREVAPKVDVLMSVCTGAFQLAAAGLLDGFPATTHHDFWEDFERRYPRVQLHRGERYVESTPRVSTAGGLTSGIDLALRVVERYYGRQAAADTAAYMEYRSLYLQ
jgi:transcriptional regulator GlxA family with amidase domain